MKKEKKVALITLLVMILNMFSPYSILFNNISNAATGVLGDDPIILNNLGVTTKGSNKILTVEIAAVTEAVLNGFDFQFKIDTSKITPCNKNTGAATTSLGMIMSQSDYFLGTLQVKNYDRNTNQFHFLATEPSGGTDIADNGYIPGQVGDDAIDVNGQGYSVYYPILKLSFKLDSSVDENSLPSDLFTLVPSGAGLPTGLKVNYTNESGIRISKDLPLATKGFTNAEKQIASISVKTNPTTTAYEHGDTIDLTGGVIQVTYDDNSTEYVDMIDPSVLIATGSPADVNNPIVKLDYKGQETSFNITVTDPIQSLLVATPMTQGEYDHGDTLNFAGLTLSAVTKSGSTTTISSTTPGLTISETTANINSPNFTKTSGSSDVEVRGTQVIKFTYDGKTAQQTIIVNDKIASINVVTQPNKTVFKYGETLDITGATVKVTLESGDTTNINLPDGSATVSAFDNTQTGSKQNLTVTINNKTASETIDVEAYNYVKETTLTEPTKVDYKYNEDLDVTGGRIKVNWANGTVSNVNLTTSMVTGYNKTQLGVQTLTISYTFTYTLSDGAQIQDPITMTYEVEVTNPAKTITITPPTKTEYEHGDSLDFTGGEIEVAYEDGTTQTKQITADMVKESSGSLVNMAPTASDYVNNEVSKTLVIKYKEDSVTGTVNYPIKIKNVVNKIEMSTNPTNTTYNIGDTSYKLAGGAIKVTRKAGNTEIVALTDNGVTLTNLSTLTTSQGTKEVTVTYEEKTTTFNITVQNGVRSINITTPTKTTYNHGETLDVTGGKIEVTYVDGTTQDKELDVSMITESDGSPVNMAPSTYGDTNKESKTLLIKYQEDGIQKQENYTIDIINDVKQIAIQGTAQSQYNINDQLQPGLSILVTRASGVPEAITVTNSMLTNFSTATEGTRTATITYTENGITKTTTFVYTVKDTVTSISVKNGPTNATKYGEDIDLTGVTIDVVKGSGTTTIPVTKDMIKAGTYDPDKTGNQVIKIVYEGQETTLTINVKDYVTGITINPVSVTGKYNDTLSSLIQANNIQYTVTYAKAGAQTPEVLAESMVSGYSAISTQDQNLTVTYTDTDADSYTNGQNFTTNLKVTLSKEVSSITITAPSKTTYEHGETIATDGIITVVFTDGTQTTKQMNASMITENDGSPLNMSPAASEYTNNKLSKTLKITYTEDGKTETINYPIEIVNKVQSITIKGTPKTSYNVNEALDNNIIITIHRQTGEDEDVTVTSSMIPSFDTTTETSGTPRSSDIEYTENGITLRVPYTYTVIDEVSNINVNTQPTNATKYGEDVDLTGVTIDVVKGSGTTTIPVTNDMIKPGTYDPDKTGNQVIKIVYGGQETTLTINVKDYVTGIAVNPVSVTGKYNDTLSSLIQNNNIQYTVTYAKAGAQTPEVLVENMVSGYTATSTQDQDLTVTYTDTDTDSYTNGQNFTTNLKVTLDDTITGMTLEQTGTVKTDYKYDEEFDVSNLVIVVHKLSGDQTVPVMKDMIKNYNKQQLGNQTVSVEYNGTTVGTINVTVKDYIASVVITVPSKITYKYNEELDLSDAKITITMASKPNEPTTIAVTPSMISGYNKTQVGAQTVTITYTDNENNVHTQTFGVRVEDSIKTITLENNNFKTNYKYGENLDLSGLTLKVTKESGEISTVAVTTGMISGYNPNKLGSQTLTINYEGKQFTIVVNVVDYVTDIILTPPTKDEYKIGESLSLVGGSITEKMASGANGSTISLTNSMVSGFDSTTPGTKNLTVTYVKDGKTYTKTFQVAVINTINHIEVIAPTKTDYKYGENLNLSGGSVKIYMEDGTIKTVPLTSQMVTGYSKTTPGQQMLKVTYTSDDDKKYEGYFKVTVGEDYIKDTKFVAPTKKEYRIGDTIDLTGGSITEVYASEKLGNKYDLTNSMISGFDSTTPGTKQITVTFNNKTYQYSVTVKDRTLGISIKTLPNKLEYKKGENLDLTGATLNVVKESGTQVIKITADMVSGYDKNKAGIQVIKVTYEGFTTQFSILVKEEVPATNPDEPNTPDDNKPNTSDKNNSTSNTTPSVPSIITKVEESTEPEENANEETKLEEDNKNTQEDNKESLVSGTNDNQNNNTPKDKGTQRVQEVLNILGSLLVLIALAFIIIVLAKRRKNVKIYIEEGDEKVLVGKERLTKDNRELDLNKYYNKYKEDEYKIVLSKSISKKLDKKTVSLTVHDKKESFVVNYDSKEYIYKT
ncbi:MAG TPA: bacterial Ig-like domain-containing protein [Clostridiaceae bacterium]|nr:bacterial Ig-like domain-containing protein [Clostridiaceae bacterium]